MFGKFLGYDADENPWYDDGENGYWCDDPEDPGYTDTRPIIVRTR